MEESESGRPFPEIRFSPLVQNAEESGLSGNVESSADFRPCGMLFEPDNAEPENSSSLISLFQELNSRFYASGQDNQDALLKMLKHKKVQSDRLLKKPEDVENNLMIIDYDYYYKSYKDGPNVYNATPLLIRIDTGHNTEARISSDFLTWQDPVVGFNDITVGFKWQLTEKSPSIALIGSCELPTASAGVGDPGAEPGAVAIIDFKLGKKWDWLINVGAVNNVDDTSFERYWQWNYDTEFDYALDDKSTLSLGLITICPNAYPDGTNCSRLDLGFSHNPRPDIQYYLHIGKGLSPVDRDWVFLGGVSKSFQSIFGPGRKEQEKK